MYITLITGAIALLLSIFTIIEKKNGEVLINRIGGAIGILIVGVFALVGSMYSLYNEYIDYGTWDVNVIYTFVNIPLFGPWEPILLIAGAGVILISGILGRSKK